MLACSMRLGRSLSMRRGRSLAFTDSLKSSDSWYAVGHPQRVARGTVKDCLIVRRKKVSCQFASFINELKGKMSLTGS